MKTRFCDLIQSPDANEGALKNSNYSTERSKTRALLFEAMRTVILPLVRLGADDLPRVELQAEAAGLSERSCREQ